MPKHNSLPSALALALALLANAAVRAQELTGQEIKPIVSVAFSGYGALISDLNFVGTLAGNPQLGAAVDVMVMMGTGGHEFRSLDRSKPWGAVAFADGGQIRVLGFVPLGDLGELKTALEANAAEFQEADGILTTTVNNQDLCIKSAEDWIFLSNQADVLGKLPKDPVAVLNGLEKTYNLAARIDMQNLPETIRETLLGGLQMGLQAGMGQRPDESDEAHAQRSKLVAQRVEEFRKSVSELQTIQFGLAIDEKAHSIYLDIDATALPGTNTARRIMAPRDVKTSFGGFMAPDAAVSFNGTGLLEPFQVEQLSAKIDDLRARLFEELADQDLTEADQKAAQKLIADGLALITSAAQQRQMDLGMLLLTGQGRATWLGGVRVADGAKVEEFLKAVLDEAAKETPELKQSVKPNAAEHSGVRLHTLSLPTDKLNVPQLAELFGEQLLIVVGIADKAAYLSAGTDSLEALKKAIDASSAADKGLPPLRAAVSVASLAQLVAEYAPNPQAQTAASLIVDKLADSKGKDRVTVTTTIVDNGQRVRIELEEGLLKILPTLPGMVMGGAGR